MPYSGDSVHLDHILDILFLVEPLRRYGELFVMRDLPPAPRILTATPNHATAEVLEKVDEQQSAVFDSKLGAPRHLLLQNLNWTVMFACRSDILGLLFLFAIQFFEHGLLFDESLVARDNESCYCEDRGEKAAKFGEKSHKVL